MADKKEAAAGGRNPFEKALRRMSRHDNMDDAEVAQRASRMRELFGVLEALNNTTASLNLSNPNDIPAFRGALSSTAQAMQGIVPFNTEQDERFVNQPILNSKTFAKVKALPQIDKVYLVYSPNDFFKDIPPILLNKFSDELKQTFFNEKVMNVLAVDEKGFNAGKRYNIVQAVQALCCSKMNSNVKNVLSAFVVACLEPAMEGKGRYPARPQRVLFESPNEANHPQVKSFMSMMGCSSIDTAPPALMALVRESNPFLASAAKAGNFIRKDQNPGLHDFILGKLCGNCGNVSPKLKCPCRLVYYCSKECQAADWKTHKKHHTSAMAALKVEKDGQAAEDTGKNK